MNEHGFDNFCRVTGRNNESLFAAFEFSLYLGFASINPWALNYPSGLGAPDWVMEKIKIFEGPNGETMIKAWLARRNSWRGRLKAWVLKPAYVIGFFVLLFASSARDWWRSW